MKTFLCVVCGEEFEPYRDNQKFCSKICRDRVDKDARRFNGIRQYVLQRDEFKCTQCGATNGLVVHHQDCDKFNNIPENLATLCRSCHASYHNQGYFEIRKDSKYCVICGNEFYPIRDTHILCWSKVCRAEYKKIQKRSEHDTVQCVICSEPFVQKHSDHKCCSDECRQVYDLEQKKNRYENDKDASLERQKRYYAENKGKVKAYVKKWQQDNPDKLRAYYQKAKATGKFRVNHKERECLICGKMFKPKTKRSLCCSKECLYQNTINKNREAYHRKKVLNT